MGANSAKRLARGGVSIAGVAPDADARAAFAAPTMRKGFGGRKAERVGTEHLQADNLADVGAAKGHALT